MARRELKGKNVFKPAYYKGGVEAMKKFLIENLKYPQAAFDKKVQGSVHVKYDVNGKGKVFKAIATTDFGHGLEEEAIRLVKLMKFEIPKNRGMKITFHKDIHIHFRLPKNAPAKPIAPQQQSPTNIQYNFVATPKKDVKKGEKKDVKKEKSKGKVYNYTIKF